MKKEITLEILKQELSCSYLPFIPELYSCLRGVSFGVASTIGGNYRIRVYIPSLGKQDLYMTSVTMNKLFKVLRVNRQIVRIRMD